MKKSFLGMAESAEMRLEAVKALGSIGGDDAMKALVDASEKDPLPIIFRGFLYLLSDPLSHHTEGQKDGSRSMI